jgi:SAM-dependent methyltransferase
MALDLNAVQFLASAKKDGVRFDRVLMFGRQNLFVPPAKLKLFFEQQGAPAADLMAALKNGPQPPFAETIFQALGAKEISSLDASTYQNAEFIHDMNLPLPVSLKNRFDVVYDGGSLEHVFNAPVALKNCMEMVRPGGWLFLQTPANNWFGHGFYQFSPDFFYSAFSDENGFEVERMVAHRGAPSGRWHEVIDPKKSGRCELLTLYPLMFLIRARKIRETEIFASAPQQSYYDALWKDSSDGQKPSLALRCAEWFKQMLPEALRFQFFRRHSFTNRRCFKPVKKD